jgi:hypothetical protein
MGQGRDVSVLGWGGGYVDTVDASDTSKHITVDGKGGQGGLCVHHPGEPMGQGRDVSVFGGGGRLGAVC